jgi:hypothetical protein
MDLVCFLLGVLLYGRRRQALPIVMAGLSAGYALAGVMTLSDWWAPRTSAAGAFIGFWVAFPAARRMTEPLGPRGRAVISAVGLLLVAGACLLHRPDAALLLAGSTLLASGMLAYSEAESDSTESDSTLAAGLAALCVGLVDGGSLPEVLRPLDLTAAAKLPMLGGFDLGAVLAECALLLVVLAANVMVRERPIQAGAQILPDIATAVLGGLGAFWFLSRLAG